MSFENPPFSVDENAANFNAPNMHPAQLVTSHKDRAAEIEAEAEREAKIVQGRLWLISFTDLFSIMLCFFMLMYAMKDPDLEKVGKMGGRRTYDLMEGQGKTDSVMQGVSTGTFRRQGINQVEYGEALNLEYLTGVVRAGLKAAGIAGDVRIVPGRDHLKLLIDPDRVFDGGVEIGTRGFALLRALAGRLAQMPNAVTLAVGQPGAGWELAYAQAASVARAMDNSGYGRGIVVVGEGGALKPVIEFRIAPDNGTPK
ncbi:MAG: hypothetical protein H6866_02425 [Rhodospirillales bacterium]|nr:MAG: hypothetical protein H6866_02425 [Rhodospirillales bacterium]